MKLIIEKKNEIDDIESLSFITNDKDIFEKIVVLKNKKT